MSQCLSVQGQTLQERTQEFEALSERHDAFVARTDSLKQAIQRYIESSQRSLRRQSQSHALEVAKWRDQAERNRKALEKLVETQHVLQAALLGSMEYDYRACEASAEAKGKRVGKAMERMMDQLREAVRQQREVKEDKIKVAKEAEATKEVAKETAKAIIDKAIIESRGDAANETGRAIEEIRELVELLSSYTPPTKAATQGIVAAKADHTLEEIDRLLERTRQHLDEEDVGYSRDDDMTLDEIRNGANAAYGANVVSGADYLNGANFTNNMDHKKSGNIDSFDDLSLKDALPISSFDRAKYPTNKASNFLASPDNNTRPASPPFPHRYLQRSPGGFKARLDDLSSEISSSINEPLQRLAKIRQGIDHLRDHVLNSQT